MLFSACYFVVTMLPPLQAVADSRHTKVRRTSDKHLLMEDAGAWWEACGYLAVCLFYAGGCQKVRLGGK